MNESAKRARQQARKAKRQAERRAEAASLWLEEHAPIPVVRIHRAERMASGLLTEPACFVAVTAQARC